MEELAVVLMLFTFFRLSCCNWEFTKRWRLFFGIALLSGVWVSFGIRVCGCVAEGLCGGIEILEWWNLGN